MVDELAAAVLRTVPALVGRTTTVTVVIVSPMFPSEHWTPCVDGPHVPEGAAVGVPTSVTPPEACR